MEDATNRPLEPETEPAETTSIPEMEPGGATTTPETEPAAVTSGPEESAPGAATTAPATPPVSRSRSTGWIWAVAGILTLSVLVSAFELGAGLGLVARPFARPTITAGQYYTAISRQDYTQAYTYLAAPLPQNAFVAAAGAHDAQLGRVTHFTLAVDAPAHPDHVTAQVTRAKGMTYAVHLTVQQQGTQWKITALDGI